MLNEHNADLIQAGIDGELSGEAREEFLDLLRSSEDARMFHEEMQRIAKLLSEVPQVEPPLGLNSRIMDSIKLPSPFSLPEWLRNCWQPTSYGLAVAAGALLSLGLVRMVPSDVDHIPDLVGSMVTQDSLSVTRTANRLGIDVEEVTGSVRHKNLELSQALQFQLQSDEAIEVELVLQGTGYQFGGFADDENGVTAFELSGGNVRVLNEGLHQFVVFLRKDAGMDSGAKALEIIIRQSDKQVYKGSIIVEG